ncbi:N-acetylmuramoyl-L-alanine amidase family protein [Candidatus Proelusimicrobium excrementi]|uniref:N-acetylmuramoyl-L-alanine amidase family protein n=1 Tax=Candidatus Proelusimicrobium excrementi TaxID=3416222 RepID=UPI003D0EC892
MEFRVDKKIVIDAYRGGEDIGSSANGVVEKDYNLRISKYIYDRLKELGIPVSITRNSDETLDINNRINRIKSFYGSGNDVIVISNAINTSDNGAKIVYALRNSNLLAENIAKELEKKGINDIRFYQRRLPSDTSKDYNQLIRDTANNQSLIIYYGNS